MEELPGPHGQCQGTGLESQLLREEHLSHLGEKEGQGGFRQSLMGA